MALVRGIALAALTAFGGVVAFACDDLPVERPCTNIPPNGCPLVRGVSCADRRCEAIYLCRTGNVWERSETCPNFDPDAGSLEPSAGADAGDAGAGDAAPNPAAPPGAYGGPGCGVLQEPDCSVGLALGCSQACCGCEDLFVCTDGAWDLWGSCADGVVTKL